MSGGEFKLTE